MISWRLLAPELGLKIEAQAWNIMKPLLDHSEVQNTVCTLPRSTFLRLTFAPVWSASFYFLVFLQNAQSAVSILPILLRRVDSR